MFSFSTTDGRNNIIIFLKKYFSGQEIGTSLACDFLKCMLKSKCYEGVLIGSEILIKKNQLREIKSCIKKYLNKTGYFDPNSTYEQNLANFISTLNIIDESFSNLDDYVQTMINEQDTTEKPPFLTYEQFMLTKKSFS